MQTKLPRAARHTSKARLVGLLAAGTAACVILVGCASGHGKYTTEGKNLAQERVAELKAAQQYDMAEQAFFAGDLQKALKAVDNSISITDQVPKSHILRGRIMMEMSLLEQAMNSLSLAEALDSENVEAQYYLGIIYERFSQPEEALARYLKAAELDDSNPQFVVAAAEMLIDLDRLDEAESYLASKKLFFEHNAGVRQTLGHIALLRGKPGTAVQMFNEARLLAPDDLGIVEDLVRAQMAMGQFKEADHNLSRLLMAEQNKDRRDLKHMRVRCLMALDRQIEARELLLSLTGDRDGQTDLVAWLELGKVAYTIGDVNNLMAASSRVIGMASDLPDGYTFRAMALRHKGDLEGALTNIDKAVALRGDDTSPLVLRGMIQEELGLYDAASYSYLTALRDDPTNESIKRAVEALSTKRATASVNTDK